MPALPLQVFQTRLFYDVVRQPRNQANTGPDCEKAFQLHPVKVCVLNLRFLSLLHAEQMESR